MSASAMLMSIGQKDVALFTSASPSACSSFRKKMRTSRAQIKLTPPFNEPHRRVASITQSPCFHQSVVLLSEQFPRVNTGLIFSLLETASGDVPRAFNLIQQIDEYSQDGGLGSSDASKSRGALKRSTRQWESGHGYSSEANVSPPPHDSCSMSTAHQTYPSGFSFMEDKDIDEAPLVIRDSTVSSFTMPSTTSHTSQLLEQQSYLEKSSDASGVCGALQGLDVQSRSFNESKRTVSSDDYAFGASLLTLHSAKQEEKSVSPSRFHSSSSDDEDTSYKNFKENQAVTPSRGAMWAFTSETENSDERKTDTSTHTSAYTSMSDEAERVSSDKGLRHNLRLLSCVVLSQYDKILHLQARNAELVEKATQAKVSLDRSVEELRQCREANLALQYYLSASNPVNASESNFLGGPCGGFGFPFNRHPDVC